MPMSREVPLVHPGTILLEDWLKPLGISQYALARAIGVPRRRINEIIQGRRAISADTALRLAAFFGVDAEAGSPCRRTTTPCSGVRRSPRNWLRLPRYEHLAQPPAPGAHRGDMGMSWFNGTSRQPAAPGLRP